jgi:hypothetical protein
MSAVVFAQGENIYRNDDLGFEIQKPKTWKFEEKETTLFIKPPSLEEGDEVPIHFVLVVSSTPGLTAKELPALRDLVWKGVLGDSYRKVKEGAITFASEPGQSLFFESERGEGSMKWEEYCLVKDDVLYLLQFMAPKSLFEDYRNGCCSRTIGCASWLSAAIR